MKRLKACLIGDNIKYSVSPMVYDFFSKELGFNIDYDVKNLKEHDLYDFSQYAKKNLDGFNITMPHKQNIIKYLDEIDISVIECGACNAVKIEGGRLIGYNTDGGGVILALKLNGFDVKNKNIVLLGAGGAAMSISKAFEKCSIRCLTILNRTLKNAKDLCNKLSCTAHFDVLNNVNLIKYAKDADLLLNASVLGQSGYVDFDDFSFLDNNRLTIFDINYSNENARLPDEAKARGIKYINGKWMVACQAVEVIDIWLKIKVPDSVAAKLAYNL